MDSEYYITNADGVRLLLETIRTDLDNHEAHSSNNTYLIVMRGGDGLITFDIRAVREKLPDAPGTHGATGSAIEDSPNET